jgi:hypothetical protein
LPQNKECSIPKCEFIFSLNFFGDQNAQNNYKECSDKIQIIVSKIIKDAHNQAQRVDSQEIVLFISGIYKAYCAAIDKNWCRKPTHPMKDQGHVGNKKPNMIQEHTNKR